jgi:hypothetical protein
LGCALERFSSVQRVINLYGGRLLVVEHSNKVGATTSTPPSLKRASWRKCPMFPLPGCCWSEPGDSSYAKYQQRKLHMLKGWRDAVERQLAAANAAITTLEQQIERDNVS